MCRMSSCLFSGLGKINLRMSLRMSLKSNERRVQRAFKHVRHALIDRTLRSCSIDRLARRSWRWSTRPWSFLCRRRRRHRHRNGYKYTSMSRARNSHFRLLHGFADLPERGALTCIRSWCFASIYRDVPHSLLPRVRPMVMSLRAPKNLLTARGFRDFSTWRCREIEKWKECENNIVLSHVVYKIIQ